MESKGCPYVSNQSSSLSSNQLKAVGIFLLGHQRTASTDVKRTREEKANEKSFIRCDADRVLLLPLNVCLSLSDPRGITSLFKKSSSFYLCSVLLLSRVTLECNTLLIKRERLSLIERSSPKSLQNVSKRMMREKKCLTKKRFSLRRGRVIPLSFYRQFIFSFFLYPRDDPLTFLPVLFLQVSC